MTPGSNGAVLEKAHRGFGWLVGVVGVVGWSLLGRSYTHSVTIFAFNVPGLGGKRNSGFMMLNWRFHRPLSKSLHYDISNNTHP